MRKRFISFLAIVFLGSTSLAQAEPIAFEQAANVTGMAGFEVGTNVDYSYMKIEEAGLATLENTIMEVPIFIRAGIPVLEVKLELPYSSLQSSIADQDASGIQEIGFMIKSGLLTLPVFSFALGVDTVFPIADPMLYLSEGLNLAPFAAVGLDLQVLKVHGNLSYRYRAQHTVDIAYDPGTGVVVTPGVELKPGDSVNFAAGLEIPAGEMITIHAELLVASYGEVNLDGVTLADSAGMVLSLVPGIRLKAGPLKAKLGFQIPLESKDDRPAYAPIADWRVLAGLSFMLGI